MAPSTASCPALLISGCASGQGKTTVTPKSDVKVKEEGKQLILLSQAVTIRDLVRALNSIGVTPRDLVIIFQAIKAAGALQAKLEIM